MLYPYTDRPETEIEARVRDMSVDERLGVVRAYVRRAHQPAAQARAGLRAPHYRFDVLADYGAFRDLQRHRMLTVEWQPLSPRHGYTRPEAVDDAGRRATVRRDDGALPGAARRSGRAVPRPGALRGGARLPAALRHADERPRGDAPASSCAPPPRATPPTAVVAQQMHRLIAEQAGHHAVAERCGSSTTRPSPSSNGSPASAGPSSAACPGEGPPPGHDGVFCVTSCPGPPLASLTRRATLLTRSAGRHVARRTATSGAGSDLGQQRVYDPAAESPTREGT